MSALAERETRPLRIASIVLGFAGIIGLLLAAAGLYAISHYLVRCRSRELAIRLAVGCPRHRVIWLLLREVIVATAIGGAAGTMLVAGMSRFIGPLLYRVSALDPLALTTTACVLVAAASVTLIQPARLATGISLRAALMSSES